MKFASRSRKRSSIHRPRLGQPAVVVESCESRLLLTTPNILTPTGTVTADTVEVRWEAVDNAASYEVWITSLESYERVFYAPAETGTSLSIPAEQLSLGRLRIWARATLNDSTMSAWSPASNAVLRSTPQVTGPAASATGHVTDDSTPAITWTSANGASHFEIWVTDFEAKLRADETAAAATLATGETVTADLDSYRTVYRVDNRQFDANGQVVTDAAGNPVLAEVRSYVIPQDQADPASEPRDLSLGRYRVWIRAFDPSFAATPGQTPAWSDGYTFQVSTRVQNVGPTGTTFQVSPNITWDSVEGATHYEVFVSRSGQPGPLFRRTVLATTETTQSTQMVLAETGRPFLDNGDDVLDPSETVLLERDGSPQLVQIPHTILTNTLQEDVISTPSSLAAEYTVWVRSIRQAASVPTVFGLWSAPARFRTIEPPQVTGPIGEASASGRVVRTARPLVEWTPIDGAARYEVLVHRFNSRPPFLEAQSTENSYTFTDNVPAGTYTIWVRGVDARGRFSDWSDGFQMVASGGAPVITAPVANTAISFLTVEWTAVPNAQSYQVWVAQSGGNFELINESGITGTTFSGTNPLATGSYRVWVRALLMDGTFGLWSNPIMFQGAILDADDSALENISPLLASVDVDRMEPSVEAPKAVVEVFAPEEAIPVEIPDFEHPETAATAKTPQNQAADGALETESDGVLTRIAQQCVDAEWWNVSRDET